MYFVKLIVHRAWIEVRMMAGERFGVQSVPVGEFRPGNDLACGYGFNEITPPLGVPTSIAESGEVILSSVEPYSFVTRAGKTVTIRTAQPEDAAAMLARFDVALFRSCSRLNPTGLRPVDLVDACTICSS